jgi:hypothetical protein
VNKSKAQREFVVVTLIAVISIALIIAVYATLLGTFTGQEVVFGTESFAGEVLYSRGNLTDPSNWTDTLAVPSGGAWYATLNITNAAYSGEVNVTFQLQEKNGASWGDTGTTTTATIELNGTVGERVYVSSNGQISINRNWQTDCTAGKSYRVEAAVETTG